VFSGERITETGNPRRNCSHCSSALNSRSVNRYLYSKFKCKLQYTMFYSRKMRFAVNFVKKGKKYKAVFQISLAQCGGPFTAPKFAIRSQSEGVSTVLISCVIKPLPNMATLRRSQDFSKGWGGVGSHHGRVLTRFFSCHFRHLLCVFC